MKRLVALFVVLVILAAVVFYFGWIQIKLDEDSYAVIFTKTGGWEEEVVSPGTFTWRWQRLVPTNLTLHIFPIVPHSASASLRGSLPSAAAYGALLETTNPFSYLISVDVVYRLNPDALPRLARDDGIRSDTMDAYYRRIDNGMEQVITEATLRLFAQPTGLTPPASAVAAIAENLSTTLRRQYPDLEILSVSPTRLELPDTDLYLETKQRYLSVLDARTGAMQAAAEEMATDQIGTDLELGRLERYGEILERYPILLEYFRLAQDLEFDSAEFESFILPPSP
jgi:hypothetical protein